MNLNVGIVLEFLKDLTDFASPGWIVVATALLMALVARLMANPVVNAFLTRFGFGRDPSARMATASDLDWVRNSVPKSDWQPGCE